MSEISIDLVIRGPRLRGIDKNRVIVLMASIRDVGGLHRLEAIERLCRATIVATVTDLSGPAAILAECLITGTSCGADLSQSTASRRLGRRWRPSTQKRPGPALAGTSTRAESDLSNTTISTPKSQRTILVRALGLDGEADGYRIGHRTPAQHNVHRVAEVAP
jgi:hypothetical protein